MASVGEPAHLPEETRVALLVPGSAAYVDLALALLADGVLPVPLDLALTPSERGRVLAPVEPAHLVLSPLHHSAPLRFATGTLLAGGRIVVPGKFDPEVITRAITEERPTTMFCVPTHLQRLFAHWAVVPGVDDVAVYGAADPQWGPTRVRRGRRRHGARNPRRACEAGARAAKRPKDYALVPALPMTATGKVRRDALPAFVANAVHRRS